MSVDVLTDEYLEIFEAHVKRVLLRKPIEARDCLLLVEQIRQLKEEVRSLEFQLSNVEYQAVHGESL